MEAKDEIDGLAHTGTLLQALQRYFDLMYECDTAKFQEVFSPDAQLQGIREGRLVTWSYETYKGILEARQSPKSLGARREEQLLLCDFASRTQALTKIRVRINGTVFLDYLTWHRVAGAWRISSKAYHVESIDDAA